MHAILVPDRVQGRPYTRTSVTSSVLPSMASPKQPPAAPVFCRLEVKALPGASSNAVTGTMGNAVKIKLRAPPVEGRANEALIEFLSEQLGVHHRAITLERGDTSRLKLLRIEGLDLATVRSRLGV